MEKIGGIIYDDRYFFCIAGTAALLFDDIGN